MIWFFLFLLCAGTFGTVFFSLEYRQTRIDENGGPTVTLSTS